MAYGNKNSQTSDIFHLRNLLKGNFQTMSTPRFSLWLEFEEWIGSDDREDCFNMQIVFDDGRTYALNVWTLQYLEITRQELASTGDCLAGSYVEPPDLFVASMDRELIERVVLDLIKNDGLRNEWLVTSRTDSDR